MTVQEIGYDEDSDQDFREAVEAPTGTDLVDGDRADTADVVLLWFREDNGDLTDALVDFLRYVGDGGYLLLLTPPERKGRPHRARRDR